MRPSVIGLSEYRASRSFVSNSVIHLISGICQPCIRIHCHLGFSFRFYSSGGECRSEESMIPRPFQPPLVKHNSIDEPTQVESLFHYPPSWTTITLWASAATCVRQSSPDLQVLTGSKWRRNHYPTACPIPDLKQHCGYRISSKR